MLVTKRVGFSALHELKSPHLTEQENLRIFGKCYRTHGHDYFIEATVEAKVSKTTGLGCDRHHLEDVLMAFSRKYNQKHLNHFFEITTGECLAEEFFNLLAKQLKPLRLLKLKLQETPKNSFTIGLLTSAGS